MSASRNKISIILDIDETLTTDLIELNPLPYLSEVKKICTNADRYINALRPHFLHQGVVELIMALTDIPNVVPYFFSLDQRDRNLPFVRELFLKAQRENYFIETEQDKRIYSGPDAVNVAETIKAHPNLNLGLFQPKPAMFKGNRKKDISKIGISAEDLPNAVIADDNPGYILKGQEENFVHVFPCYPEHLKTANEATSDNMKSRSFQGLNHIFYLAGLLIPAIQRVNQGIHVSLSEELAKLQLKHNCMGNLVPNYADLQKDLHFYYAGLAILKKYNPNLEFLLPSNLQQQLNLPMPSVSETSIASKRELAVS